MGKKNEYSFKFEGTEYVYEFCDTPLMKIIEHAIKKYENDLKVGSMGMRITKRKKKEWGLD